MGFWQTLMVGCAIVGAVCCGLGYAGQELGWPEWAAQIASFALGSVAGPFVYLAAVSRT